MLFVKKEWWRVKDPLVKETGDKIQESEKEIADFSRAKEVLLKCLFLTCQDTGGESYHLYQKLTEFHHDSDCVKRNAGDLSVQSLSVQEERRTNQNLIGILLQNIMSKIAK